MQYAVILGKSIVLEMYEYEAVVFTSTMIYHDPHFITLVRICSTASGTMMIPDRILSYIIHQHIIIVLYYNT